MTRKEIIEKYSPIKQEQQLRQTPSTLPAHTAVYKKHEYKQFDFCPVKPDPEVKKHVEQLKQRMRENGAELPIEWKRIDKQHESENRWSWHIASKPVTLQVQRDKLMCKAGCGVVDLLVYLSDYV